MKSIYKCSSSKRQILLSEIVIIIVTICSLSIFLYWVKDVITYIFSIDIMVTIGVLFYSLIIFFGLIQAGYNGLIYRNSYKEEKLEINNNEGYLIYSVNSNNHIKEVKANYDDIYLIKRYKATFINLYYYEVFYTENNVIKKIVVSISLATNLEKKIKKKIKLIKEENVFCTKLPLPESWIS